MRVVNGCCIDWLAFAVCNGNLHKQVDLIGYGLVSRRTNGNCNKALLIGKIYRYSVRSLFSVEHDN
jgi:hypothetical protein